MTTGQGNRNTNLRRAISMVGAVAVIVCLTGCSHAMMMFGGGARRPAATEFGLGPRTSANRLYTATLEPAEPFELIEPLEPFEATRIPTA